MKRKDKEKEVGKKIKVAIFHCGFLYSGGGERIVLEEARGLKKRGYEVEVYAPVVDEKLSYPEFLKEIKVKTFLPKPKKKIPLGEALWMILSSIFAPVLSAKFRNTDVFLGANQPGAWIAYCVAKILRKPYLVYLNQPNRLVYPRKIDKVTSWQTRQDYYFLAKIIKIIKPIIAWFDKISFTSGKAMLVNGDYIGRAVKKIYQKPIVLCPGAAHPQAWEKLRLNSEDVFKGEFKINNLRITKPYILVTNRHEPQKKFEYVIRAMKRILKKIPQVTLVIPGSFTSHTLKLIDLAKRLKVSPRILFLGQVSEKELQKLYQEAAVYCYPAPDEDFGLGPLEAGAWGVPTVAWNHGGPTVTVKHNKTGYLAKPYKISDYAEGIIMLLSNPQKRAEMGKAAWNHIKNNFSWRRHIDILEKEIKRALNEGIKR